MRRQFTHKETRNNDKKKCRHTSTHLYDYLYFKYKEFYRTRVMAEIKLWGTGRGVHVKCVESWRKPTYSQRNTKLCILNDKAHQVLSVTFKEVIRYIGRKFLAIQLNISQWLWVATPLNRPWNPGQHAPSNPLYSLVTEEYVSYSGTLFQVDIY